MIYIYNFVTFHSSCQILIGVFFARPMHFTSEFAMTVLSKCVCVWVWGSIGACSVSLTASHAHTHTHKHPGDDRKHGKATSLYISESNGPLAYPSVQDSRWPHCRCRLCTKYQMWSFVSQVDQVLQNFAQCSAVGVSRSNDTIQA